VPFLRVERTKTPKHSSRYRQRPRVFRLAQRADHGDFRSGDDCLAGCDNLDFEVTEYRINSPCNGSRLGCVNLLVKDSTF